MSTRRNQLKVFIFKEASLTCSSGVRPYSRLETMGLRRCVDDNEARSSDSLPGGQYSGYS